jgi:hypothetical protein
MGYRILISALPDHGEKRQLMVPGGQLMAENDRSWKGLSGIKFFKYQNKLGAGLKQ